MVNKFFKGKSRTSMINTVGFIGILANALFAAIKVTIGLFANSVAIMSDAINNLSDALSSVITLLGFKLARKDPDKKHPLGYGRIEYMSSLIISVIILFAGFQFLTTSFKRIVNPEDVSFSTIQLVVLGITLIGKLLLAKLNISVGKLADSLALKGSGADALMDSIASGVTIITAIISKYSGLNIDGYVGLLLAAFIIYTGFTQLKETIDNILGERPESTLVKNITADLKKHEEIKGAYDFIIHNYGPTKKIGTVNLEFEDIDQVKDVYKVMFNAQREIFEKYQIYFTFGLYSVNTYDQEIADMYDEVKAILTTVPHIITFHAFYVDKENNVIRFDIVHDFDMEDIGNAKKEIEKAIKERFHSYTPVINVDLDYA